MEAGEAQWEPLPTEALEGRGQGEVRGVSKGGWARFGAGHHPTRNPDEVRQESGAVRHGS